MSVIAIRPVFLAAASALFLASIGCAAEQNDKEGLSVDQGATTYAEGGGGGGYDPPPPPPPPPPGLSPADLQKRITAAWQYAVGGDTFPRDAYPCTGSIQYVNGVDTLAAGLNALRGYLTGTTPAVWTGSVWLSPGTCSTGASYPSTVTVNGVNYSVAVSPISCSNIFTSNKNAIVGVPAAMDQCWPGVSGAAMSQFWKIGTWSTTTEPNMPPGLGGSRSDTVSPMGTDPEPAHLYGSLYGNGSAASSWYINSGVWTNSYQWPSSWAVGSLPAGAPCATYAAGSGTILYSTIQASGSYRKCM